MSIKFGSSRIVLIFNKHVLKIAMSRRGVESNRTERKRMNEREFFLPVLWIGLFGILEVMPRAQAIDGDRFEILEGLMALFPDDDEVLRDYCPENWGMYNERVVKIDYGY